MINNVIEASYREGFDLTRDNPLIWALPKQKTKEEFRNSMLQKPVYSEKERELDSISRLDLLSSFRQNLFLVDTRHYELYLTLYKCIIRGYKKRNPLKKEAKELYTGNYHELTAEDSPFESNENSVFGFTLLGTPGVGKTSSSNQILKLIPPVLTHSNLAGVNVFHQVVYLKIECPKDGSTKQLCINFFEALDNLLSRYTSAASNFTDQFRARRYTVGDLTTKMAKLAGVHNLGILIIDEIQHLRNNKTVGFSALLNFLVEFNNKMHLPIFLIGTPDIAQILQSKLRLARRCGAEASFLWKELNEAGEEWNRFLDGLWKYQWTQNPFPLTDKLNELFHEYSNGIVDLAIKLFEKVQERAIVNGKEMVDEALIRRVVKELWMERPAMKALKSKDPVEIRKFEDIYIPSSIEEAEVTPGKVDHETVRLANIISSLVQFNVEVETAEKFGCIYLERFPESGVSEIVLKILIATNHMSNLSIPEKAPGKKPRRKPKYGEDALPSLLSENSELTFQNLQAKGHIKDPIQEFLKTAP